MDWEDPLRHLAPIPQHPAKASPVLLLSAVHASDHQQLVNVKLLKFRFRGHRHNRAARILGAFFLFLEDKGHAVLGAEILAWIDTAEDKVLELANHAVAALLLPFKAYGGKAPAPIPRPHPIFAGIDIVYDDQSRREEQTELRRQCLPRDGYRCVYTGLFDWYAVKDKGVVLPDGTKWGGTDCAHIIPFAFGDSAGQGSQEARASIWWTLYRYFPVLRGKIGPDSVNQLGNVVSLFPEVCRVFGDLELSFWPSEEVPHAYKVTSTVGPGWAVQTKSSVCMEQRDADVPMPDPEYFEVHQMIAQILEASGLGREIDELLEAAEEEGEGLEESSDRGLLVSQRMLTHRWV